MNQFIINCDGGARGNPGPAASAFVISTSTGEIIFEQGFYLGHTTNNQAEYQAVVEAMKYCSQHVTDASIVFQLDSQLVVNQINGSFKVKDMALKIKYDEIKTLIKNSKLDIKDFVYIPRAQNSRADLLVNQTLDQQAS